jgi:hypothetical protein
LKDDKITQMSKNIQEIRDHNKKIFEVNEQLLLLFLSTDTKTSDRNM